VSIVSVLPLPISSPTGCHINPAVFLLIAICLYLGFCQNKLFLLHQQTVLGGFATVSSSVRAAGNESLNVYNERVLIRN